MIKFFQSSPSKTVSHGAGKKYISMKTQSAPPPFTDSEEDESGADDSTNTGKTQLPPAPVTESEEDESGADDSINMDKTEV